MYGSFLRFWESAVESFEEVRPETGFPRTTPQRFLVGLAVLTSTEHLSERSLSHRLGINRRTIHNMLTDAERMGWVTRSKDGWVSTPQGREIAVRRLTDIVQRLNEHELDALREALHRGTS